MKIKIIRVDESTIGAFAEKYDLEMVVRERDQSLRESGLPRFYCSFQGVEVKIDGGLLSGVIGGGETVHEAIESYCTQISGKRLVYRAYTAAARREIAAPVLTPEWEES